jgi:hypothetical protein
MMGTLYLAALEAGARMAEHLGDQQSAGRYRDLARNGAARLDALIWNGEYYVQQVDTSQKNASKYQYGEGCLSDQLLGQWFAEVVDLGKTLPHEHIRTTLQSIYRYNFRTSFEEFANAQRIFALDDEGGLLLCSWPRGRRPALPFVYSDEVWTGIEYQVAAHLIYEGMTKEGLAIVEAARRRYDGARRNPWDELECGHHYARALSSWSLLTALSGFLYSAPRRELRLHPRVAAANFRCLYSTGLAWGVYAQTARASSTQVRLTVEEGALTLATLRVPFPGKAARARSRGQKAEVEVTGGAAVVRFQPPVQVERATPLEITLA